MFKTLPLFRELPFQMTPQRKEEVEGLISFLKTSAIVPVLSVSSYNDVLPVLSLYLQMRDKKNRLDFIVANPEAVFSGLPAEDLLEFNCLQSDLVNEMTAFVRRFKQKQSNVCLVLTHIDTYLKQNTQSPFQNVFLKESVPLILVARQNTDEVKTIQRLMAEGQSDNNGLENQVSPYSLKGFSKCHIIPIAPLTDAERLVYFRFCFNQQMKNRFPPIDEPTVSALLSTFNQRVKDLQQEKRDSFPYSDVFRIWEVTQKSLPKNNTATSREIRDHWKRILDRMLPRKEIKFNTQHLMHMNANLKQRIYGQERAIDQVCDTILSFLLTPEKERTHPAVLAFFGPSGVGKTALADEISLMVCGKKAECIQLNQFQDAMTNSNLIGSAKGYVDSEEDGLLAKIIKKNPRVVILLDEFEKAHVKVQQTFLGIFDKGVFSDNHSGEIDCKNVIFILTSNAGLREDKQISFTDKSSRNFCIDETLLRKQFPPEVLGRINAKIYFNPLTDDVKRLIVGKCIREFNDKFKHKHIAVSLTEGAVNTLIKDLEASQGARPVLQAFDQNICRPVRLAIMKGEIDSHDTILFANDLTWQKDGKVKKITKHACNDAAKPQQKMYNS